MELRRYWEVLWRRKRIFALITGVIVTFTFFWAFSVTPVYKATTRVVVRTQDLSTVISSTVPSSTGKLEVGSETVPIAIKAMIENKDSLNRVIKELKLVRKDGTLFSSAELLGYNFINIFLNKIGVKIKQISDSDVFEISAFSADPEVAVKFSNAITSNFLKSLENLNREEIGKTIDTLTKESSRLKEIIQDSEETIKRYKLSNMAINITDIASSYASQLVTTELAIVKMATEKKEKHPDLKVALEQIALIKRELHSIPGKQIELLRLDRINTALVNVYTSLLSDLEKAKVLNALSITNILVLEKAQIPDDSKKFYIYFPKKKVMLILALIIGSIFGVIGVFFAEYIDDTIKNPRELKAWTGQKVLATIPQVKNISLFPPKGSGPIFEAISDLWLSIKMGSKTQQDRKHPRMLTISSYGDREGKSLVAAYLGLLLSKTGYKTLIIDLNFKEPFLSKLYAQPSEKGVADYIAAAKEHKTDDLQMFKMIDDNLYFLSSGLTSGHDRALVINSPYLLDLINIAKKEFDVIIVDTSSLNKGKEPFFVAKESDGTILVVEAGRYQIENIRWSIEELAEAGALIIGTLLNKLKCTS